MTTKLILYAPITKAEMQADGSMIVTGIATTEKVDRQGEMVEYEGAKAAFESWPGNIREMHDPTKAVGRRLDIMANDETREIAVRSRISAGAKDTIEKLRDGTLRGYSIGGIVLDGGRVAGKVDGKAVTILRAFDLAELSLVDAPANPDATISIVKANVGTENLMGGLEMEKTESAEATETTAKTAEPEEKPEGETDAEADKASHGEAMKMTPEAMEMMETLRGHLTAAAEVIGGLIAEYKAPGEEAEADGEKMGDQEAEKAAEPEAVPAEPVTTKAMVSGSVEKALRSELAGVTKQLTEMKARFDRIESRPAGPMPVTSAHAVEKSFGNGGDGMDPSSLAKAVDAALSKIGNPAERETARQAALVAAMKEATPPYTGRR